MEGRLPRLGPRGEGWFVLQLAFIVAIGILPAADWPEPWHSLGLPLGAVLIVAGLAVAGRGIFELGANLTPFPRPRANADLVERGIYAVVRHPIYAGLMLLALGWSIARASTLGLLLSLAFIVFLDLKARREEDFLGEAFAGYAAYRRRTRRFIPGLY